MLKVFAAALRHAALLLFCALSMFGQIRLHVPRGRPAMIDGNIGPGEWTDAAKLDLGGIATLYAKQSEDYVWMAIDANAQTAVLDLFLSPQDGFIYNLHASAKLGERKFTDRHWPEWRWWNNTHWVANVSRFDSFENRSFLPAKSAKSKRAQ